MNARRIRLTSLRHQHGLGLIEIMVALAISAVLLTGVIQIFLSSKLSYRVADANARVQEGGRFAVNFITDDLRMAGYTGCFRGELTDPSKVENVLNTPAAFSWDLGTPLAGHDGGAAGWSPALPGELAGLVRAGTDVVITRGLDSSGIRLVPPFPAGGPGSAKFFVNEAGNNLNDADIVMVTDCRNGSIFQITNQQPAGGKVNVVHSSGCAACVPGNTAPQLGNRYGADAEIARLQTNIYYIGTNDAGEPALFRMSLANNGALQPMELIAGAEDMQVLYGEDADGDGVANRYARAHEVTMENVVSVRYSLLLRSEDNITGEPQVYLYNGEEQTAADRRLRRVFGSTVKLRNRGLL
ncbi:MAG: PilW family protein [Gammaproteobacteria bacterium]|jgi:type IV pilus assembly protein PilW|nr:PilW family protein [Gammaproteobacteria bacterium]